MQSRTIDECNEVLEMAFMDIKERTPAAYGNLICLTQDPGEDVVSNGVARAGRKAFSR